MSARKTITTLLFAVCAGTASGTAFAEGTDDIGPSQALRANTALQVDILDAQVETIVWTGSGSVDVTGPGGQSMGSFAAGAPITPVHGVGRYGVNVLQAQSVGQRWDVSVVGAQDAGGRVRSTNWQFDAGAFSSDRATNGSFYAMVPGGGAGMTAVIELKLEGLAGYVYDINANRIGVNGPDGGRSVPVAGNGVTPEFPIYLRPPSIATYSTITPNVSEFSFDGGTDVDIYGDAMQPCNMLLAGESTGYFRFDTDVQGSFHVVCDLDADDVFERTNGEDLLLTGVASPGTNSVGWTGLHDGQKVPPGEYQCKIYINVGEFHYVGRDIETSYPGMRLYEVGATGTRSALPMFWNDAAVQANAVPMPNGEFGLESSGEVGILSSPYSSSAVANAGARSWGEFAGTGKGNLAYLDTWTTLESVATSTFGVTSADGAVDSDGDGLSDFEEQCFIGSDPLAADSDGDGTPDGEQYATTPSPAEHGGIESNGRRAHQLARRSVLRSRMSMVSHILWTDPGDLDGLLPDVAARPDLARELVNISDLIELTNAETAAAANYLDSQGRRVGSAVAVSTFGGHYEHSKPLCDRVRGAVVESIDIVTLGPHRILAATLFRPDERYREHAFLAKLLVEDEQVRVTSGWLQEHHPSPGSQTTVVELQVWAASRELGRALMAEALADAESRSAPELETPADQDEVWSATERFEPLLPERWVRRAELLGTRLALELDGRTPSDVALRIEGLDHGGRRINPRLEEISAAQTSFSADVPMSSELTVELLAGGKLVDRVWLSDGVWTRFDDALWGGSTRVSHFESMVCERRAAAIGGVRLGGCVRLRAEVGDFAGVARHLARRLDLRGYAGLQVAATSNVPLTFCVHSLSPVARACTNVDPEGWIDFASLQAWEGKTSEALRTASMLTFTSEESHEALAMDLGELELLHVAPAPAPQTRRRAAGCDTGAGGSSSWILLLVAVMGWASRRRGRDST